jgi:anthraniloyl-CoA monooxygenase
VLRLQSAARNSLEWFENVERYLHLDPIQFAYSLLTRSQRISHENLRLRDKTWLEGAEAWFQRQAGANSQGVRRPMFAPFRLRDMSLKNRVVVSPMAQYKAVNGCPTDWHLVHYGASTAPALSLPIMSVGVLSGTKRPIPGGVGKRRQSHLANRWNVWCECHAGVACHVLAKRTSGPEASGDTGAKSFSTSY